MAPSRRPCVIPLTNHRIGLVGFRDLRQHQPVLVTLPGTQEIFCSDGCFQFCQTCGHFPQDWVASPTQQETCPCKRSQRSPEAVTVSETCLAHSPYDCLHQERCPERAPELCAEAACNPTTIRLRPPQLAPESHTPGAAESNKADEYVLQLTEGGAHKKASWMLVSTPQLSLEDSTDSVRPAHSVIFYSIDPTVARDAKPGDATAFSGPEGVVDVSELVERMQGLSFSYHDVTGSGNMALQDRVTRPVQIAGRTLYCRGLLEAKMAEELVGLLVLFSSPELRETWHVELGNESVEDGDSRAAFDIKVTHYELDGDVMMSNT